MRILSMTATFGKLQQQTLTLEPGLNILEAPNEWGKSTWSAFLLAMFYGLDTRAKTTKTALADKERYAPWSGAPMSGRMELEWQGRRITIERNTKRRIPLGEFRAYETDTGLRVPELTAGNCGQLLLGVEQSVFRRSGFIRHSDLPVTQDEALRRRLNALVTTGDESGSADRLAAELKNLKNRIRYNRSGLLPQAEAQRDSLEQKLQELETLRQQSRKLRERLEEEKQRQSALENHQKMLNYSASREDALRVAQARDARDRGLEELARLEHATAALPDLETARKEAERLQKLTEQWNDLQLEWEMLPREPEEPRQNSAFAGLTGAEAAEKAKADAQRYETLGSVKGLLPLLVPGVLALICALVLLILKQGFWALIPAVTAGILFGAAAILGKKNQVLRNRIAEQYDDDDPEHWWTEARNYARAQEAHQAARDAYFEQRSLLQQSREQLRQERMEAARGQAPEKALYLWNQAIRCWEVYHNALRDQQRLEAHLQDLQKMARTAGKPTLPDNLTCSEAQTAALLNEAVLEQQRLGQRLSQYQGRMEALGDPEELKKQRDALNGRITRLEEQYAALTIAQETLLEARMELQRRFAPRIANRARELMARMTGGRYDRLTLGEDFSLQSAARSENTLQDAWWRSDGTVDQLYLALRLAVAEELTPDVPVILDDALVRFDDNRLKAALEILRELADRKQVILFTCQSREKKTAGL